MNTTCKRWGALWRSRTFLHGQQNHLVINMKDGMPVLFHTRKDARAWIKQRYGYIKDRPDLMAEPHGWRMPIPVRVVISCE